MTTCQDCAHRHDGECVQCEDAAQVGCLAPCATVCTHEPNDRGTADEKRFSVIASAAREDDYWREEEARAERSKGEEIAWLIEHGPLPDAPVVTYDGSMAQITLKEAGRRLGLSDITLRSAIRRGRMNARKLGRDWLVEESEVRYYELTSLGRVGWPKGRSRKSA